MWSVLPEVGGPRMQALTGKSPRVSLYSLITLNMFSTSPACSNDTLTQEAIIVDRKLPQTSTRSSCFPLLPLPPSEGSLVADQTPVAIRETVNQINGL